MWDCSKVCCPRPPILMLAERRRIYDASLHKQAPVEVDGGSFMPTIRQSAYVKAACRDWTLAPTP